MPSCGCASACFLCSPADIYIAFSTCSLFIVYALYSSTVTCYHPPLQWLTCPTTPHSVCQRRCALFDPAITPPITLLSPNIYVDIVHMLHRPPTTLTHYRPVHHSLIVYHSLHSLPYHPPSIHVSTSSICVILGPFIYPSAAATPAIPTPMAPLNHYESNLPIPLTPASDSDTRAAVILFMKRLQPVFNKFLEANTQLPLWRPDPNLADEKTRRHITSLKIPITSITSKSPSLLLHNLGKLSHDTQLAERLDNLFCNDLK